MNSPATQYRDGALGYKAVGPSSVAAHMYADAAVAERLRVIHYLAVHGDGTPYEVTCALYPDAGPDSAAFVKRRGSVRSRLSETAIIRKMDYTRRDPDTGSQVSVYALAPSIAPVGSRGEAEDHREALDRQRELYKDAKRKRDEARRSDVAGSDVAADEYDAQMKTYTRAAEATKARLAALGVAL